MTPPLLPMAAGPDVVGLARRTGVARGEGRVDMSVGRSSPRLLEDLRATETNFITPMGRGGELADRWGDSDEDRYDRCASTLHVALREHRNNSIIASLRLTPLEAVTDSLTWAALSDGIRRDAAAHRDWTALQHSGSLWDLTRLVNIFDRGARPGHRVGTILELLSLAAGLSQACTPERLRREVRWIFATNGLFQDCLNGLGIELTVLAGGKIRPGDKAKTYLCALDPGAAIRHICAHPDDLAFTYRHVDIGLQMADLNRGRCGR